MRLSDMALYASDLSPEQRRELSAQAAAAELRALAASTGSGPTLRAGFARSACWLLLNAGDPCRAVRLARWALKLDAPSARGDLRQVIDAAKTRAPVSKQLTITAFDGRLLTD